MILGVDNAAVLLEYYMEWDIGVEVWINILSITI